MNINQSALAALFKCHRLHAVATVAHHAVESRALSFLIEYLQMAAGTGSPGFTEYQGSHLSEQNHSLLAEGAVATSSAA